MINKNADDCASPKYTLDQPLTYQIKIAGQLGENWPDWLDKMEIRIETKAPGFTTTTLTGTVDQAALLGLLRRLYYLGFPLISVNCIQFQKKQRKHPV